MKSEEIICPVCKNTIEIKKINSKYQNIKCPRCNNIFQIFRNDDREPINTDKLEMEGQEEFGNNEGNKSLINQLGKLQLFNIDVTIDKLITQILGILLVIIGIYILLDLSNINLNIGSSLIIIGISFFFLSSEFIRSQEKLIINIIKSDKIIIIFSIWILISLLLTMRLDFKLFLIIVIIGFLTIKELTKSTLTEKINKRMKIFMIAMFLIYLMLVVEEIATFLSQ